MRSSNMSYLHEGQIGTGKRRSRRELSAERRARYPSRHADFPLQMCVTFASTRHRSIASASTAWKQSGHLAGVRNGAGVGRVLARHDFLDGYARVEPVHGTVDGSLVLTDNNLNASPSDTQQSPDRYGDPGSADCFHQQLPPAQSTARASRCPSRITATEREDGLGVRPGLACRRKQRGHCPSHHLPQPRDGVVGNCRRSRNRRATRVPCRSRLPFMPGFSVQQAAANRGLSAFAHRFRWRR